MEKNFDIIGNDSIKLYIQKNINFDINDQGRKLVVFSCIEDIASILNCYTDKNVEVIAFAFTDGEP